MNIDTNADSRKTMMDARTTYSEMEREAPIKESIQIRTCLYRGEKALWHRWVETNDDGMPLRAMIETEDDKIHFVMPWSIQFIDNLVERRHR